jgi:hypothetical protein
MILLRPWQNAKPESHGNNIGHGMSTAEHGWTRTINHWPVSSNRVESFGFQSIGFVTPR